MRSIREEVPLTAEGIDQISQICNDYLKETKLERRSAMAARLSFETALMGLRDCLGNGTPATVLVHRRLGRARISVLAIGPKHDTREVDWSEWETAAMESCGIRPSYAYRGGKNIISLTCPPRPWGALEKILFSAALALALSAVLSRLLPQSVQDVVSNTVFNPLADLFISVLSGLAGPLVFCSVAWGVCGIGDISALGRMGGKLLRRFFANNVLGVILGFVAILVLFPLGSAHADTGGDLPTIISETLLGIVPTNLITPFADGNMPQIIVLAAACGAGVILLGEKGSALQTLVRQGAALTQLLMEQLCRLLPAFVFVIMFSLSWSGELGSLGEGWLPLVLVIGLDALLLLIQVVLCAAQTHESIVVVFRKILPVTMVGLATASSSASFGTMHRTCVEEFGASREVAAFGIPLGIVLNKPTVPAQVAVFMAFSASVWGVQADLAWYVTLAVQCMLYSVAVPPVPGGMLAVYGLMFSSLGIPSQALVALTALDIVLDYTGTASDTSSVTLNVAAASRTSADA